MYFFTHLFISKVLYKHFKKEIQLDKWAFAYGNIKPDLPPACFGDRHTLENYFFIVYDQANQLMHDDITLPEYSVKLGEVCHFVCDFFCYYHLNDHLHKKIFSHLIYEIRLHFQLCTLRFKKKLEFPSDLTAPKKGFAAILYELRREYFSNPQSMKRDIDYALSAAVWTFKTILYFTKYSLDTAWLPGIRLPARLQAKGGSYESSIIC